MICKNRTKNHTKNHEKTPGYSGVLFFKETLKSDVPNGSDMPDGVILPSAVICLRRDICPSGKLRIYLNFG